MHHIMIRHRDGGIDSEGLRNEEQYHLCKNQEMEIKKQSVDSCIRG